MLRLGISAINAIHCTVRDQPWLGKILLHKYDYLGVWLLGVGLKRHLIIHHHFYHFTFCCVRKTSICLSSNAWKWLYPFCSIKYFMLHSTKIFCKRWKYSSCNNWILKIQFINWGKSSRLNNIREGLNIKVLHKGSVKSKLFHPPKY